MPAPPMQVSLSQPCALSSLPYSSPLGQARSRQALQSCECMQWAAAACRIPPQHGSRCQVQMSDQQCQLDAAVQRFCSRSREPGHCNVGILMLGLPCQCCDALDLGSSRAQTAARQGKRVRRSTQPLPGAFHQTRPHQHQTPAGKHCTRDTEPSSSRTHGGNQGGSFLAWPALCGRPGRCGWG